ncbi:MAG: 5-(carboxyamino)imidazole ribonucleotide mutase [Bdellovibrionia bacterium]
MSLTKSSSPVVSIVMGSDSDYPVMKEAAQFLDQMQIAYEMAVVSAHRTPHELFEFAQNAHTRGIRAIIAGAGGAAHLPGMVAALTPLPVIGVPVPVGALRGEDALLSMVQMPKGVPVATVAIGNAWNAGVLAAQILASSGDPQWSSRLLNQLLQYKQQLREQVLAKRLEGQASPHKAVRPSS